MHTEAETARSKLRDLAEARLSLYVREMGEDSCAKLVANKANWRAGYLPAQDVFAVFPQSVYGDTIVGPFTVVKWRRWEIESLIWTRPDELDALVNEARDVGFEQWAST